MFRKKWVHRICEIRNMHFIYKYKFIYTHTWIYI